MMREGTVLAIVYSVGANGVEISLPKILGATLMGLLVYGLLAKFAYPQVIARLDRRSAMRRQAQLMQQRARASLGGSYFK